MRGLRLFCIAALLAPAPLAAQEVRQSELEAFVAQVQSCWAVAPEDAGSGKSVTVRVALSEAGEIETTEIMSADKSASGRRLAAGAIRALERCAPYSFSAESYEHWTMLQIDLHP